MDTDTSETERQRPREAVLGGGDAELVAKLDLLRSHVAREALDALADILARGPAMPPRIGDPEQLRLLKEQRDRLAAGDAYGQLLTNLRETIQILEKSDAPAARERLALLLGILQPYIAHARACEAMTAQQSTAIRERLQLRDGADPFLRQALTTGAPFEPPSDAPEPLQMEWKRLEVEHRDILRMIVSSLQPDAALGVVGEARGKWMAYQRAVQEYEERCRVLGRRAFLRDLHFPEDLTDRELNEFLSDLTAPIPDPASAQSESRKEDLKRMHVSLESERRMIANKLPAMLLHPVGSVLRKEWLEKITEFLMRRALFEQAMGIADVRSETWLLYAGMVVNELAEEGFETFLKLDGESALRKQFLKCDWFRNLDAAARSKILQGWQEVKGALAAKGVPVQRIGNVLQFLNRSSLGPRFWSELLSVESGATVLLWGYYLSTAENKFKASLQFGSFIALSSASNRCLRHARVALRGLEIHTKLPKHPAVQFAAALFVAYVGAEKIDQFTTWIDRQFPDDPWKHDTEIMLSMVSGESIMTTLGQGYDAGVDALLGVAPQARAALEKAGLYAFDPDRTGVLDFLGQENIVFDEKKKRFERQYSHSWKDWNARLDALIAAEQNPILKRLWTLQKIEDPSRWAARRSVILYSQTRALQATENALATALQKDGLIGSRSDLPLLTIATRDGEGRNDRAVAFALGSGLDAPALPAIANAMERRPAGDGLKVMWEEYVRVAKEIAKDVSIYRHVGVYNRRDWLGEPVGGDMPPMVRDGMMEEIRSAVERRRAVRADQYGALYRGQDGRARFSRDLTRAVYLAPKLSFSEGLEGRVREGLLRIQQWGTELLPNRVAGYESDPLFAESFALLRSAESAAQHLPSQDFERAIKPLMQLVESRRIPTADELRRLRVPLDDAVLHARTGRGRLTAATEADRARLRIDAFVPCFFQGTFYGNIPRLIEFRDGNEVRRSSGTIDPLESAFATIASQTQEKADLLLFQGDAMGGNQRMAMHEFVCRGADPKMWTVRIRRAQLRQEDRRHKSENRTLREVHLLWNREETMPFLDWMQRDADAGAQLESTFHVIREREQRADLRRADAAERMQRDQDENDEQLREAREEQIRRAEQTTDAFVNTTLSPNPHGERAREYRRRYGDNVVIYTAANVRNLHDDARLSRGPMISVAPSPAPQEAFHTDVQQPNPEDGVTFRFLRNGREERSLTVRSFAEFQSLSDDDRRAFRDLVCTPCEDGEQALQRIIRLFPHRYYDSGFWGKFGGLGGLREQYVCRDKLFKMLYPRYLEIAGYAAKETFLQWLWDRLAMHGEINKESTDVILAWFAQKYPTSVDIEFRYYRNGRRIGGVPVMEVEYRTEGEFAQWAEKQIARDAARR